MNLKNLKITKANSKIKEIWLSLRIKCYPDFPVEGNKSEIEEIIKKRNEVAFIAFYDNKPIGLIEGGIRLNDDTEFEGGKKRCGLIGSWYIEKSFRKMGVGGHLVKTIENWAKNKKCTHMISDCYTSNTISFKAHKALGYKETERLIHFEKKI